MAVIHVLKMNSSFHLLYIRFIGYINRNSICKHFLTFHGLQEQNIFKVTLPYLGTVRFKDLRYSQKIKKCKIFNRSHINSVPVKQPLVGRGTQPRCCRGSPMKQGYCKQLQAAELKGYRPDPCYGGEVPVSADWELTHRSPMWWRVE